MRLPLAWCGAPPLFHGFGFPSVCSLLPLLARVLAQFSLVSKAKIQASTWPRNLGPLAREERKEVMAYLQAMLTRCVCGLADGTVHIDVLLFFGGAPLHSTTKQAQVSPVSTRHIWPALQTASIPGALLGAGGSAKRLPFLWPLGVWVGTQPCASWTLVIQWFGSALLRGVRRYSSLDEVKMARS